MNVVDAAATSRLAAISLAFLMACTPRLAAPPPPRDLASVAVLTAKNSTGDDLVVAGGSPLKVYVLHSERVTVPDLLTGLTRDLLGARGYRVIPEAVQPGATSGPRLTLEIRRWEPDSWIHPAFVIVGVGATLVDGATGRELWSAHPPIHPIATPGAIALGAAYEIAAHKAVAELFDSWPQRRPV